MPLRVRSGFFDAVWADGRGIEYGGGMWYNRRKNRPGHGQGG